MDIFGQQGACEGTCSKRDKLFMNDGQGFVRRDFLLGQPSFDRSRDSVSLDFDNDGWLDLFVSASGSPQNSRHRILRNRGKTGNQWVGFETIYEGLGNADGDATCAETSDVDMDGWPDLVVCEADSFRLFRNVTGEFSSTRFGVPHMSDVVGANFADVNADGWPDLLIVRDSALEVRFNRNGSYPAIDYHHDLFAGHDVVAPDMDGDGDLDLLVVQATSGRAPETLGAHLLLLNGDCRGGTWISTPIPQPALGSGDKAQVFTDFAHSTDAVLVGNGGNWDTKGPRQWLTVAAVQAPLEHGSCASGSEIGLGMFGSYR
jgi:hypothetical protein